MSEHVHGGELEEALNFMNSLREFWLFELFSYKVGSDGSQMLCHKNVPVFTCFTSADSWGALICQLPRKTAAGENIHLAKRYYFNLTERKAKTNFQWAVLVSSYLSCFNKAIQSWSGKVWTCNIGELTWIFFIFPWGKLSNFFFLLLERPSKCVGFF